MPNSPDPGQSETVSISVSDPNMGEVERSFVIRLPSRYSIDNDAETPLLLDFHGWHNDANSQAFNQLEDVSDEDEDGGFILVRGNGVGDPSTPDENWGSWNCSRTDGPLGPPCVLPRPESDPTHCYESCGSCDVVNSCDWTSCYDDIAFVRAMIDYVEDNYCLDAKSIHLTGYSNGGMFSYYAASRLNDIVASIAPNAGSPLLGFGDVPLDPPVSVIDFHGFFDNLVPYDTEAIFAMGEGPHDSVISTLYYYFEQKPDTVARWAGEMGCLSRDGYPTAMDGVNGWLCEIWSGCSEETEFVTCTGDHGHTYPFGPSFVDGTRILWDFMKRHRKS